MAKKKKAKQSRSRPRAFIVFKEKIAPTSPPADDDDALPDLTASSSVPDFLAIRRIIRSTKQKDEHGDVFSVVGVAGPVPLDTPTTPGHSRVRGPAKLTEEMLARLQALRKRSPTMSKSRLAKRLGEELAIDVSRRTVARGLKRLGLK